MKQICRKIKPWNSIQSAFLGVIKVGAQFVTFTKDSWNSQILQKFYQGWFLISHLNAKHGTVWQDIHKCWTLNRITILEQNITLIDEETAFVIHPTRPHMIRCHRSYNANHIMNINHHIDLITLLMPHHTLVCQHLHHCHHQGNHCCSSKNHKNAPQLLRTQPLPSNYFVIPSLVTFFYVYGLILIDGNSSPGAMLLAALWLSPPFCLQKLQFEENCHTALCSYPLVKMEIGDSWQISTTAPIFSQYDYFRQTIWRLASVQFHFWYIFGD